MSCRFGKVCSVPMRIIASSAGLSAAVATFWPFGAALSTAPLPQVLCFSQ